MGRWAVVRGLAALAVVIVLLDSALFAVHPPWRTGEEALAKPELPPKVEDFRDQLVGGVSGQEFSVTLSGEGVTALVGEHSLTLTDDEVTAVVGYALAKQPDIPFTQVRIQVKEDKVVIDGQARVAAFTMPVRVVATAGAKGGLPWVQVEDVSLGDTPLPGFIRREVLRRVNESLDFTRYELPVTVGSIEMGGGRLTIEGKVR